VKLKDNSPSQKLRSKLFDEYKHYCKDFPRKVDGYYLDEIHLEFWLSCSSWKPIQPQASNRFSRECLFSITKKKIVSWEEEFTEIHQKVKPFLPLQANQCIKVYLDAMLEFDSEVYSPIGTRINLQAMLQSAIKPGIYPYFLTNTSNDGSKLYDDDSVTLILHHDDEMYLFPHSTYLDGDHIYLICSRSRFKQRIQEAYNSIKELEDLNLPWHDIDKNFDMYHRIYI